MVTIMYYTTTQFSQKIGISANTLRTWDKRGILKPAYITEGGRRLYTDEQAQSYLEDNYINKLNDLINQDFRKLSKDDMKCVIEKYEHDFNTVVREHNALIGMLRYMMYEKD